MGEFAIANVQCQYELSDTETEERATRATDDHTYDTRDEPPAFIIHQIPATSSSKGPFVEVRPSLMTLAPGCVPAVNVIHIGDRSQITNNTVVNTPNTPQSTVSQDFSMNKRIRRSEVVLRQAADCVSRGSTFQTVSEQFNIPISTIRFFMARKGILPRRRRGRSTHMARACSPEEPPFHMQHFKLPDMLALRADDDTNT
ncbi:unnamed protein product [Euphydryas editha]|uniref:HTH psq-type domain-containing protein n=1 Tax=Euphydryas editha TaxID=104508 RepID=A0AAU9UUA8_EUPED|nr:unnamed protein product [Euphydryas editha]